MLVYNVCTNSNSTYSLEWFVRFYVTWPYKSKCDHVLFTDYWPKNAKCLNDSVLLSQENRQNAIKTFLVNLLWITTHVNCTQLTFRQTLNASHVYELAHTVKTQLNRYMYASHVKLHIGTYIIETIKHALACTCKRLQTHTYGRKKLHSRLNTHIRMYTQSNQILITYTGSHCLHRGYLYSNGG